MAEQKVWVGSVGPFLYNDADLYEDEDGDLSGQEYVGVATTGTMVAVGTPSNDNEVLRWQDRHSFSSLINATLVSGVLTLNDGDNYIALTGEGDAADTLTKIEMSAGGTFAVGVLICLTGKASLSYNISMTSGTYLKLQSIFTINDQYDSILLLHRGSDIWQEVSRVSYRP